MAKPRSIQGEQQDAIQQALWADPDEARSFLESLSDQFIHCRAKRHIFEPLTVVRDKTVVTTEQCACGAKKVTEYVLTRYGLQRLGIPSTTYPSGYLSKGIGRLTGGPAREMIDGREVDRVEAALTTRPPRPRKRAS
jgi:hypothetical protein